MMDIYLIIAVMFITYIVSLAVVMMFKEKIIEAFAGGSITWLLILLISFFIPISITCALIMALIGGAVIQYGVIKFISGEKEWI